MVAPMLASCSSFIFVARSGKLQLQVPTESKTGTS